MSDILLGHQTLLNDVPADAIEVTRDAQGNVTSVKEYYEDRMIKAAYDMRDGAKHGEYLSFYPNGEVNEYGYFIKGQKHGRATKNFADGRLWIEQNYRYGQLNGRSSYYDAATGKLVLRMHFRNDLLHGLCESYEADGGGKYSVMYQNGVVDAAKQPPAEPSTIASRARTNMAYRAKPKDLFTIWRVK